jgi:hypothetical protein
MSKNIYKEAAVNTLQSLPKRFLGWVLGVYTAELIKLRAVEQTKKDILADLITKQTRRR